MKLTSKKQTETNCYELEIQVEEAEFAVGLADSYKKNASKLSIPGFRKGKAPKNMVMKMVGEPYFYEDAINLTYRPAYDKAIEEAGLSPVDRPDIEVGEVSSQGYSFTAKVTNKPEVALSQKDYLGLPVSRPFCGVTDEEVDHELGHFAESNSRLVEVGDGEAMLGDTAEIDFLGLVDDVPFPGGKGEGHSLVLGSGSFIPGFEEQLVGHKAGEEFDISVNFPEEYHEPSLKGKSAVFKIVMRGLKRKELPAIDDELAKDVSEFDSLQELRDDIRKKMLEQKEKDADQSVENDLVKAAADKAKIEIPRVMIENKIDEMIEDFAYRLQSQGLNLETYLRYTGSTPEAFKASFEEGAAAQVRARLTLERIVELENILVSDEEVEDEYKKPADAYGAELDRIKSLIDRKSVVSQLGANKAIDLLKEKAVITEEKSDGKKAGAKKSPAEKK